MPERGTASEAFWRYSLAVYGRPGVERSLLTLQDRHGLDVNLLLFCLWAGQVGHHLDEADLSAAEAAVREWRDRVVVPLRRVRRWLKIQDQLPAADVAPLRQAVKVQELESERIAQRLIAGTLAESLDPDDAVQAGALNLARYLRVAGLSEDAAASQEVERLWRLATAGSLRADGES